MNRRLKHTITKLTLLALGFKLMLPLVAFYSNAHAGELHNTGEKTLICTSEGYRWVSLDELSQTDGSTHQPGQHHCPLCLLAKYHNDIAITHDTSVIFGKVNTRATLVASTQKPKGNAQLRPNTRAPPVRA